MGMGTDPVAPGAGAAAAAPSSRPGAGKAVPTAEEYRTVAILVIGLLIKGGLVAALVGLLARGGRTVWRRLRRGGRR